MAAGATLDRTGRKPPPGVSAPPKWYTFVLRRFDGTSDRMDTADPEAAAFVIRAWERDRRTRFITMQIEDRAAIIYGERDDLALLEEIERVHGPPGSCRDEWCPFYPDPRYSDICKKCPNRSAND